MLPASEVVIQLVHISTVPALTSSSTRGFPVISSTDSFCLESEEAEGSLESKFCESVCINLWQTHGVGHTRWVDLRLVARGITALVFHPMLKFMGLGFNIADALLSYIASLRVLRACPWTSACTSRPETAVCLKGQVEGSCSACEASIS